MKTIHEHPRRLVAAFSLMETLVATGIIATALMGSVGMMAVGLGQSRESIERTHAAMLAQKVFADFHAGSPVSTPAVQDARYTKALLPLTSPDFSGACLVFDENFQLLSTKAGKGADFAEGASEAGAAFIVRITGTTDTGRTLEAPSKPVSSAMDINKIRDNHKPLGSLMYPFDSVSVTVVAGEPSPVGMSNVAISVEAPASVPAVSRKIYRYEFLRQF